MWHFFMWVTHGWLKGQGAAKKKKKKCKYNCHSDSMPQLRPEQKCREALWATSLFVFFDPHPNTHYIDTLKSNGKNKKREGKPEGNGKEKTFSNVTVGEILERRLYSKLTTEDSLIRLARAHTTDRSDSHNEKNNGEQ